MSATAARLGARVLRSPNFGVLATLFQAADGRRTDHGEWEEGQFTASPTMLVTAPVSGQERALMPEGIRDKELRKFWLTPLSRSVSGMTEGDVIRHESRDYRLQMAQNWSGFYEAICVYPFTGTISDVVVDGDRFLWGMDQFTWGGDRFVWNA